MYLVSIVTNLFSLFQQREELFINTYNAKTTQRP